MPMMATTVIQSQSLLPLSAIGASSHFTRPAHSNPYTKDHTSLTSVYGSNIWQSNNADYAQLRDKSSRKVRSQQPELFLSIKNTQRPLDDSERDLAGSTSPASVHFLSAHSRSQRSSTALLTPTSLASPSGIKPHLSNGRQEFGPQYTADCQTLPRGKQDILWPNVKEFQPSWAFSNSSTLANTFGPYSRCFPNRATTYNTSDGQQRKLLENIWGRNEATLGHLRRSQTPTLPESFTSAAVADGLNDGQVSGIDNAGYSHVFGDASQSTKPKADQVDVNAHPYSHGWSSVSQTFPIKSRLNSDADRFDHSILPIGHGQHNDSNRSIAKVTAARYDQIPAKHIDTVRLTEHDQIGMSQRGAFELRSSQAGPANNAVQLGSYPTGDTEGYADRLCYDNAYLQWSGHPNRNHRWQEPQTTTFSHQGAPAAPTARCTDSQNVIRSPLLEEFRLAAKGKKYEIKDIRGHIVEFSGDQQGSRFIQHKLETANSEEKDCVFQELINCPRQLMTDVFGNYVIQKMFDHGNQVQKKILAGHMKGHMMTLSTQTYGCRVVQKAFEHVLTDQQASLVKELDGHVLAVVADQNGNHVIQKAIELIPGEHTQFIVNAHIGRVGEQSKHPYGCRVMQRMLEFCSPQNTRRLLSEIHRHLPELLLDAFGNYVVQHVIEHGDDEDRRICIDAVNGRLLDCATSKFASNVVEKALERANESQRHAMLRQLTARDSTGQSQVMQLLSHQFGNYVIQKCVYYLSGHALHSLLIEMDDYCQQLRRVSSGKQVSALEKSIQLADTRLRKQGYLNTLQKAPALPRTNTGHGHMHTHAVY